MINEHWNAELQRFAKLDERQKTVWLASLIQQLTILARGTYGGTEHLFEDPERMRRINEVLHKVSDQLLNTLLGVRARPEAVFMAILEEEAPQISDPSDLAASLRSIG